MQTRLDVIWVLRLAVDRLEREERIGRGGFEEAKLHLLQALAALELGRRYPAAVAPSDSADAEEVRTA